MMMETVININKSNSMKNILGVMKHTFKTLRITYIVEAVILVLAFFSSSFFSRFTLGLDLVPAVAIILTINFIAHLIVFSLQISKEHGNLLFLAPMKGIEFIIGHFLELILVDSFVVLFTCIMGSLNAHSVASMLIVASLGILIGLLSAHLIISGAIVIVGTYIRSTGLCVLGVIIACGIGNGIYDWLNRTIISFLPYFYLSIGRLGLIEIDIFSSILDLIALIVLQLVAAHMIDKKLDIY